MVVNTDSNRGFCFFYTDEHHRNHEPRHFSAAAVNRWSPPGLQIKTVLGGGAGCAVGRGGRAAHPG